MGQDIFDLVVILTLVFFTLRGAGVGLVGEVAGFRSWAASGPRAPGTGSSRPI